MDNDVLFLTKTIFSNAIETQIARDDIFVLGSHSH